MNDVNIPDPLQPQDDIFNPNIDEEHLDEDNASPAAPPDDIAPSLAITDEHPETDTGVDRHEQYDEGLANATGADDQIVEPDRRATPVLLNHEDTPHDSQ